MDFNSVLNFHHSLKYLPLKFTIFQHCKSFQVYSPEEPNEYEDRNPLDCEQYMKRTCTGYNDDD